MAVTPAAPTSAVGFPLVRIFPLIISGMLTNPNTGVVDYNSYKDTYYVVVVDCGSSGSRVHAYKFSIPKSARRKQQSHIEQAEIIKLERELYVAVKPGLSSYADNPREGGEVIANLVREADNFVPEEKKAVTPVVVRATAGLRALPVDKSDKLIDHVCRAVSKLGYLTSEKTVKLLAEADEGIYMWYAVNLLTRNLGKKTSLPVLEIGGGSAQITFILKPEDIPKYSAKDVFVRPAVFSTTLFSHSFLGLGIGAVRIGSLQLESGRPEPQKEYTSVCVDPVVKNYKTDFFGLDVKISGISRKGLSPEAVFSRCREIVEKFIKVSMKNVQIKGVSAKNGVAAIGYFYHYVNDEGLIPPGDNGKISVHKLMAHAMGPTGGCAISDDKKPWRCFDAVFLVSLLQDGYGFDETTTLLLYNDIDGYEVSWALGLAYNYVMAAITSQPGPANIYDTYIKSILSKRRK